MLKCVKKFQINDLDFSVPELITSMSISWNKISKFQYNTSSSRKNLKYLKDFWILYNKFVLSSSKFKLFSAYSERPNRPIRPIQPIRPILTIQCD